MFSFELSLDSVEKDNGMSKMAKRRSQLGLISFSESWVLFGLI